MKEGLVKRTLRELGVDVDSLVKEPVRDEAAGPRKKPIVRFDEDGLKRNKYDENDPYVYCRDCRKEVSWNWGFGGYINGVCGCTSFFWRYYYGGMLVNLPREE